MRKGYAEDPIKEISRKEIYKFANKSLPNDRSKVTAIYLASTNSKESEWLDRLGIPRFNRIILEEDETKFEEVKLINKDIVVLPLSLNEFLKQEAKNQRYGPFWYCGLDFENMLGTEVTNDLTTLATNGMIMDGGVLYTNLVGYREQDSLKEDYIIRLFRYGDANLIRRVFGSPLPDLERFLDIPYASLGKDTEWHEALERAYRMMLKFLPKEQLDTIRSFSVRQAIHDALCNVGPSLRFLDDTCPEIVELLKRSGDLELDDTYGERYRKGIIFGKSVATLMQINRGYNLQSRKEGIIDRVAHVGEGLAIKYFIAGNLGLLVAILCEAENNGYVITSEKSFMYTSNKNTKMLLDVMQLKRINPYAANTLQDLIDKNMFVYYSRKKPYLAEYLQEGKGLRWLRDSNANNCNWLERKVGHLKRSFLLQHYTETPCIGIRRINLGSAFRQPLTNALARKCIREGLSDEEIDSEYQVGNWNVVKMAREQITLEQKEDNSRSLTKRNDVPSVQKRELPKLLMPGSVYRILPEESKKRINYFIEEVIEPLHPVRRANIRKAFSYSNLKYLIKPEISSSRIYAFFDDISLAIMRSEVITPEFLNKAYISVRDAVTLTPIVESRTIKEPHSGIKNEVIEMINAGFSRDEVWEVYKQHFSSRRQFGAVIRWGLK